MIKVAICGAAGRMGKAIHEVCQESERVVVAAAVEHPASAALGKDAGEVAGLGSSGIAVVSSLADVVQDFDVLIDFTLAAATVDNVAACRAARKRMVIGTTGLDEQQKAALDAASRDIAMVFAPNMSVGVNLCFKLAQLAAEIIGQDSDIEIIEAHHNRKQDAPSGTAVRLGEIIASTLHRDLGQCAVYGRRGQTGARDAKTIGFETIRAGDIVGEHTVMFAAAGERVEITHKASSRRNFAAGAVRAARWIMEKDRGLFDMQDVLGLR